MLLDRVTQTESKKKKEEKTECIRVKTRDIFSLYRKAALWWGGLSMVRTLGRKAVALRGISYNAANPHTAGSVQKREWRRLEEKNRCKEHCSEMLVDWQLDQNVCGVVVLRRSALGVRSGLEVDVTQPSEPLPLASSGWTDERQRGSSASCGQLTHPIGTDARKGSTCYYEWIWAYVCMCLNVLRNYSISSHTRGIRGEIPSVWVVPSHLPSLLQILFLPSLSPVAGNSPVCVVSLIKEVRVCIGVVVLRL